MEIRLQINNPDLEQQLIEFIKQQKHNLEDILLDTLKKLVSTSTQKEFIYIKNPLIHNKTIENVEEFRRLSKQISVIDKDIDILSLDKDINNDIF